MYVHNRGELRFSRKVSSSCYTGGTRRVTQVTNPVIRNEWGNDQEVPTTFGTYFRSDDLNLTNRKPRLSNVPVSNTSLLKKLRLEPQAFEYRINWEIHTPYESATGLVLNINGKFTMGKLKSSLVSYSCVFNLSSLSISKCRSRC